MIFHQHFHEAMKAASHSKADILLKQLISLSTFSSILHPYYNIQQNSFLLIKLY